jgi:biotin operon repressor
MTKPSGAIPLGFEVGTGAPVAIPLHHLVVTGLTQLAGKTTTIEALVSRSQLRAVCFVTKRGEIGFRATRHVRPYFRERADWQYVESILEAAMRERMRFERSWIMRACKGATTLAEVHANVRRLLQTAKGIHEGVYTALDHYLEIVVPQIATADFAPSLTLGAGLNLVDLSGMSAELQALVIRSTIETVMERERGVVTVLPEAWEFLPQTRGGPVKYAAELLLRQGAVLGNFVWLDSQDLAGVDKKYLKGCGVWLLGCQPEANEAEHTLRQIPVPRRAKPDVAEIQTLPRGTFYACGPALGAQVTKVYVQPSWLPADQAQAAAKYGTPALRSAPDPAPREETPTMCQEHVKLQRELEVLGRESAERQRTLERLQGELAEGRRQLDGLRARGAAVDQLVAALAQLLPASSGSRGAPAPVDEESLVRKVLARLPATGGGPLTVTPPEKLRADFQREEVDRLVKLASGLPTLQKRVLMLLETTDGGFVGQPTINQRLGRSTEGGSRTDMGKAVQELQAHGLVEVKDRAGARRRLRDKIVEDLAFYQATDADVAAVHQAVLHALATAET